MKELILIRGLPGAGKTTIAHLILKLADGDKPVYSIATDQYFERYNGGEFDPELLDQAHQWTENHVFEQMEMDCPVILIHNTFTQPWEWQEYEEMAEEHGYRVHHIIVEKR